MRVNPKIFDNAVILAGNKIRCCGHKFDFHSLLTDIIAKINPVVADFVGDMTDRAFYQYCLKRGYSFADETANDETAVDETAIDKITKITPLEIVMFSELLSITPSDKEGMRELIRVLYGK